MPDERERFLIRYLGGFSPFVVARAEGIWLETTDGRRLLDFSSGQICSTLGHRHPRVMARSATPRQVVHLDSRMLSEPLLALAQRLAGARVRASSRASIALSTAPRPTSWR